MGEPLEGGEVAGKPATAATARYGVSAKLFAPHQIRGAAPARPASDARGGMAAEQHEGSASAAQRNPAIQIANVHASSEQVDAGAAAAYCSATLRKRARERASDPPRARLVLLPLRTRTGHAEKDRPMLLLARPELALEAPCKSGTLLRARCARASHMPAEISASEKRASRARLLRQAKLSRLRTGASQPISAAALRARLDPTHARRASSPASRAPLAVLSQ
jgi:hypothetical protein